MQHILNEKRTPACKYCAIGRTAPTGAEILCVKRGIMCPDSSCKHFKYDPLKREPERSPKLKTHYSAEDFKL